MERVIAMVTVTPGGEEAVVADIRKEPRVTSFYQLYGLYDMLMIIEAEDEQTVKSIISSQLRSHPKVASILTMKVLQSYQTN